MCEGESLKCFVLKRKKGHRKRLKNNISIFKIRQWNPLEKLQDTSEDDTIVFVDRESFPLREEKIKP